MILENGVEVINVMADGSICEDLSTYWSEEHPLPPLAMHILGQFVRDGLEMIRQRREAEAAGTALPETT